jgi:chemotaxis response regulator CheB
MMNGRMESFRKKGPMKRIFMLSSHPLLGQGVESLLRRETGLEIVGREMDVDKAVERIKELRPDAVILDCAEPKCDPTPAVIRILGEGLGTKVIGGKSSKLDSTSSSTTMESAPATSRVMSFLGFLPKARISSSARTGW